MGAALLGAALAALLTFAATTRNPQRADGRRASTDAAERPAAGASRARGVAVCDAIAARDGSDRADGSRTRPYRSARRPLRRLRAGETGCLRGGTYRETVHIRRGGRPGRRLTLRSYPGERARLIGGFLVERSAPWVTVRGLDLDTRNRSRLPRPAINAKHVHFLWNDVTNAHTATCLLLGGRYGRADGAVIERNRIHDCGELPSTNLNHGIYVDRASDAVIRDNLIFDNADRGIQLYRDAQDVVVRGNAIYGNGTGLIFSGDEGKASSGNLVEANVIAGSTDRHNVESYWPEGNPVGVRNLLRRNCLHGGASASLRGGLQAPMVGFEATGNVVADPQFINADRHDFRLRPASPCRGVLGGERRWPNRLGASGR